MKVVSPDLEHWYQMEDDKYEQMLADPEADFWLDDSGKDCFGIWQLSYIHSDGLRMLKQGMKINIT